MRLLARPRLAAALALVLGLAGLAPTARAQERGRGGADLEAAVVDVAEQARERTVLIFGVIGLGSGAVVDTSGTVVTNSHVVAGARFALVQWADGTRALMRQRGIDYVRDLAVLEPVEPVHGRPCFTLAPARPAQGAWVVALGFPGGLSTNERSTVSLGRVLPAEASPSPGAPAVMLDYSAALRHDAPIFSGNSGGPLVDLEGRLVGINGAVDLEHAVSLTVPIEVVAERIEALSGGRIVLPGGLQLDQKNPIVQAVHRVLDPFARQLPERVAQASSKLVEGQDGAPAAPSPTVEQDLATGDRLERTARAQPREAALDGLAGAAGPSWVVRLGSGRLATRIDDQHAVCKASWLAPGEVVALPGGAQARRLATSEPDDLALLLLPAAGTDRPRDALARPVGTLVTCPGQDGLLASGIVSVAARRASGALAAQIQGPGLPAPILQGIEALAQLAERLKIEALQALVQQLRQALDARRSFAAGTSPRGYPRVLAVDAPVPPSLVGGPVVDRAGDLIGVTIGVPHHGTTLVVPIARVRAVFQAQLGGAPVPETRGAARLY